MGTKKQIVSMVSLLSLVVLASAWAVDRVSGFSGIQRWIADLLWLDIAGGIVFFAHPMVREFFAVTVGRKWNLWIIPAHVAQLSVAWVFFDTWTLGRMILVYAILWIVSYVMMFHYHDIIPPIVVTILMVLLLATPVFRVNALPWFPLVFVTKLMWFYLAGTTQTYRKIGDFK